MKIFRKFSFWLPLFYPFYIVPIAYSDLGILKEFLTSPVFYILYIVNVVDSPFTFFSKDFAVVFIINLIFWFLVGLLIDKIIYKFKKSNA